MLPAAIPLPGAVGAAAVIGTVVGLVNGLRLRPSVGQTAALIDRTQRLEDSVVAALQVNGTMKPLAPLIVRQAIARVAHVDARDVVRVQLRRPAVTFAAGMVAVLLAAFIHRPDAAATGMAGAGVAGAGTSRVGAGERPTQAEAVDAAAAGGGQTAPMNRPDAPASTRPGSSGTRTGDSTTREPAPSPEGAERPAIPARGSGRTASAASTSQGSAARGPAAAAAAAGGSAVNPGGAGTASGHAPSGFGAGGASDAASTRGAGSGGVRGGALLAGGAGRAPSAARDAANTPPGEERSDEETAAWRDGVPPELRSYVRNYFRLVRSSAEAVR